jgi:hypothetical protein
VAGKWYFSKIQDPYLANNTKKNCLDIESGRFRIPKDDDELMEIPLQLEEGARDPNAPDYPAAGTGKRRLRYRPRFCLKQIGRNFAGSIA